MKIAPATTSETTDGPGQKVKAQDRQTEGDTGDTQAGKDHSNHIERLVLFGANILDEPLARTMPTSPIGTLMKKIQCQLAKVLMKPPTGGPITGPISAGVVTQAMALTNSRLLMLRTQHHAPKLAHHGAAHALHDAGDDEIGERARQRTADRPQHEHGDRRPEHRAGAEAVGGPAARRDEYRKWTGGRR